MAIIPLSETKKIATTPLSSTSSVASGGIIPLNKVKEDVYSNTLAEAQAKKPIISSLLGEKKQVDLSGLDTETANKFNDINKSILSKEDKTKGPSTSGTIFRQLGKQLMKPVGMAAEEMEGIGNAIGIMLKPLITKDISFPEASKKALKELQQAQYDAGDVLTGEKETSYSSKMKEMKWAQDDKFLKKTDAVLGLGADLVLDPLNFIPVTKLVKGAIASKGLNPAIDVTKAVVSKSKPAQFLREIFSTATADKPFMEVVNKFRNLAKYRQGKSLDEAVALQKDLVNLSKEIPDVNKLVTDALEKPEVYESITDPRVKEIVDGLKQTYKTALEEARAVGLKVGEIENYAPHIRTKESFKNELKSFFGMGSKEFSKGNIEKSRKLEGTVSDINTQMAKKGLEEGEELIQEAKKYKSADEFIKAQGTPIYHGTNNKFTVFDKSKIGSATDEGFFGRGFYFGNTKDFARIAPNGRGAKIIMEVYPSPDAKLFNISEIKSKTEMANLLNMSEHALTQDTNGIIRPIRGQSGQFTSHLQDLGYDGAVIKRGGDAIETVIFEPNKIKTKSQLLDIWKQSQIASYKANQADKIVKFFEDNPAIQLAKKGQAYAKAITSQEFANAVKSFALEEGDDLVEVTNSMLKGLKFKPEHARIIDNYYTGIKPEEIKVALKGFDTIQNIWKAQALISPSYHIRNMVGNLWNNYLAGVNPFQYAKAVDVQKNPKKYADIVEEMKKVGVLDEGWYAKDIGEEVVDRVSGVKNWKKGINPLSMQNYVFKGNRAIGTGLENNARIAHYLHMKSLGKTAEEAAESVKKFLFDYSDLTPTEKNIFKRIMPFFTWTRKNIPLQLNQLITNPAKFTVPYKIINAIESGVVKPNEKFMNDYLKNNVPVRIRTNKKGETEYFMLGQWLPFASAIDMLSQPIDNIIGMVSPFIKNPVEFTTNTSLYFKNTFGDRSKIEQYPGQQEEIWTPATGKTLMRKKYSSILKNIRVLNDINKWIDSSDPTKTADSWQVKLINTLFGKAGTYNVGKSKYFYDKDTDEYIQGLESALKNANKKGYAGTEEANKIRKELIELKKQRRAQE